MIHLSLGQCTNSDYLIRYCSSFVSESDNYISIYAGASTYPEVTYLSGNEVNLNKLLTGESDNIQLRSGHIKKVIINKNIYSDLSFSLVTENQQNKIISSKFGEFNTNKVNLSFNLRGMLLDTIPIFTIPELLLIINSGAYSNFITIPNNKIRSFEIGLWSNSQIKIKLRPGVNGEIIQNGHWLRFQNASAISWNLNEKQFTAKLKSNCSNSLNEVTVDFDSVNLKWSDYHNCYEIE